MKKTYVITGATSGIGKELVKVFAQDENNIIFAGYRNSQKIPENVPKNVIYFYIDLTKRDTINQAAEYIKSNTLHIDTLINVAGGVVGGPIEKISTDKLRHQFEINTFSHIELSQKLSDILENGRIINISSEASFGIFPFISPYCASKRALDIFFNAFAIENHKNIKVISIKPGVIVTPIWETSINSNIDSLSECKEYEKELTYIKNNALKNTSKGMNVNYVANKIKKIAQAKYPKASYTIGIDAKLAQILSLLPQDMLNNIIKFGIKLRTK